MDLQEVQGVVVEGGGERKGMEGKVVGMEGIEGKFGSEVAESGGRVSCGTVGMVGIVGIVGKGGNVVCKRWRDANAMSMLEKEMAIKMTKMMQ
ncbi:hypothetical protein CR513_51313, partial [Mucuna pruriens]